MPSCTVPSWRSIGGSRNTMLRFLISALVLFGTLSHVGTLHAQEDSAAGNADSASDSIDRERSKRPPPRIGSGDRRNGRGMRRMDNPSEADIDSFILVASELKPEWKDSLESLRAEDPAQFQQTLRSLGRRIWYLVELKAQNPNLYGLRIQEIRNDEVLWALATAHRDAEALADINEAERIKTRLKELALTQVDLKLRVRAEELAAMSSALDRLRNEVMMDLERRQAKADELVERLLSGRMSHQMQHRKNDIRKFMDTSPEAAVPNSQDSSKQR